MYGERQHAGGGDVASWLSQMSARVRDLEAENARLKQELADLRRGVGIAVLIDGHLVPLAAAGEPQPRSAPNSQPQVATAATPRLLPHTGLAPVPTLPQGPQPNTPAAARHTFGPLASTPDELPAVRSLLPAPRQPANEWLGSGDAWPESAPPTRHRRAARTLGHVVHPTGSSSQPALGTYPPARPPASSSPFWRERVPSQDERSLYADSFML
jgi:hypothetical protein